MKVYLVGSHSTGKTTLARYISSRYSLDMLPEVARQVMAEMELTLETLRTDMSLVTKYQLEVWGRQIRLEKDRDFFVSDRAFDNVAYAAEHSLCSSTIFGSEEFEEYMNGLRKGSVVFFIRPHQSLMTVDGTRENPEWNGIVRIDGMIKFMLEVYRIPYVPVHPVSMQERVRLVAAALRGLEL